MTGFSSLFGGHDESVLEDVCTTYFLEPRANSFDMSVQNEPMSVCGSVKNPIGSNELF